MQYHGNLFKTYKHATRYHILRTYPRPLEMPQNDAYGRMRFASASIELQSGDVMSVFNSIASGETYWKGQLNFLGKDPLSGAHPMGMPFSQWKSMFDAHMPVRLTKSDGNAVEGLLMRWNEQGSDDCFNVFDFHNKGYDSLHNFADGDVLEVFSGINDGNIVWQGELKMSSTSLPTGRMGLRFGDDGICRGEKAPEYVANAFINPSIKDVRQWAYNLPVRLDRK